MRNERAGKAFICAVFRRFSVVTPEGTWPREWKTGEVFPCCWKERRSLAQLRFPTILELGRRKCNGPVANGNHVLAGLHASLGPVACRVAKWSQRPVSAQLRKTTHRCWGQTLSHEWKNNSSCRDPGGARALAPEDGKPPVRQLVEMPCRVSPGGWGPR